MDGIDNLFTLDAEDILNSLPKYQIAIINEMSAAGDDYMTIADKWLNAKPETTIGFGGSQTNNSIYRDKIIEEMEKFICGDEKYTEERKKLIGLGGDAIKVILGGIAVAIGAAIGTAGAFIMPVVALVLISVGKIGKNGWCEARKEIRASSNTAP